MFLFLFLSLSLFRSVSVVQQKRLWQRCGSTVWLEHVLNARDIISVDNVTVIAIVRSIQVLVRSIQVFVRESTVN